MQKLVVMFAIWLLKSKRLSLQNKSALVNSILVKLDALPLHGIIRHDNGNLVIKDKPLDIEELRIIRDSARSLKDNRLYALIQDQILFEAMTLGVNSTNFEQGYFAKAAVWWGRRENELVNMVVNDPEPLG